MRNINGDTITQAVLGSLEKWRNSRNPRLCAVMTSLVQHLHAFARDVHPTEGEWTMVISFLTYDFVLNSSEAQA